MHPSTTTTFNLTIVNGATYYSGGSTTVTVTPTRPYANNGTYQNPHLSASHPNYEIGFPSPNAVTTLGPADFGGGPAVFDGIYHVVGPVLFKNVNVELRPGTVFYIDGGPSKYYFHDVGGSVCYEDELGSDDHYLQLFVGQDATLILKGAQLTAACDKMWGGIELVGNGSFQAFASRDAANYYHDNEISQARIGLLLGTECRGGGNYSVRDTRFEHNTYGMAVWGNGSGLKSDNGVSGCTFSSDLGLRLDPDNTSSPSGGPEYTRTGLTLRGPNHFGLTYTGNLFTSLAIGAEVSGDQASFRKNYTTNCYDTGIRVGFPRLRGPIDFISLAGNAVELPDDPNPGGQIAAGADVLGIEVLDVSDEVTSVLVSGNILEEADQAPRPHHIGVRAYLNQEETLIHGNTLNYLDEGIRVMDASGSTVLYQRIFDNLFDQVNTGVTFDGGYFSSFEPEVGCNTFQHLPTAIKQEAGADVGKLGDNGLPNNNNFQVAVTYPVENDPSNNNLDYYFNGSISPPEINNPPTTGSITYTAVTGSKFNCSGKQGLHRQSISLPTEVAAWKQQLFSLTGTPTELHEVENKLLRYTESSDGLEELATFTVTLALPNPAAFRRLSLFLMTRFRQGGQEKRTQDVRAQLLTQQGSDPELANRVRYFDALGHLRATPTQMLAPADSTALADVASSSTGFAPVACATLHALRPACTCGGTRSRALPKAQLTSGAAHPTLLRYAVQTYPNPAHDMLYIAATPSTGAATFELVEVGSGRVLRTQPLPADGQATVDLHGLAAGVYLGRVRADGQPLGNCKVVVLP